MIKHDQSGMVSHDCSDFTDIWTHSHVSCYTIRPRNLLQSSISTVSRNETAHGSNFCHQMTTDVTEGPRQQHYLMRCNHATKRYSKAEAFTSNLFTSSTQQQIHLHLDHYQHPNHNVCQRQHLNRKVIRRFSHRCCPFRHCLNYRQCR